MSTHSRIGILNPDGSVESIYCHWDGYPSHNGKILLQHYKTAQRIRALLAFGDRSVLDQSIDDADCGLPGDKGSRIDRSMLALLEHTEEYTYVFNPVTNQWFWCAGKAFPLHRLHLEDCGKNE